MNEGRKRFGALYLSVLAAGCLFLLLSFFIVGHDSRGWLGELAELSGVWESAPCVWEDPALAAALEEEPARSVLREWTAERLYAHIAGISVPERKLEVLREALFDASLRASRRQGLSAFPDGVNRVAGETAEKAEELWAWVRDSCDKAEAFFPVNGFRILLLLADPWTAVGLMGALVLLESVVIRLTGRETCWLWLSLTPLFCAGGCLAVCGSGTEKSLAGQLAARLFEPYYGAGAFCFLLCAALMLLYALPGRGAHSAAGRRVRKL